MRQGSHIDNYKYLGADFTEHLSWAQLIQSTSISANRAAKYLIAKARNSGALVFEVYTHLYNTLVLLSLDTVVSCGAIRHIVT